MLYAISGTQGSGKTTILNELKKQNYNVIGRKTSRSVLLDWNITLDDIYNNHDLMKRFQDELLKRKIHDELEKISSKDIWFTDRSYVDLLAYSAVVLGYNDNNKDWLDEYYQICRKHQMQYTKVFYIEPLPFITRDGIRGTSIVYNAVIDMIIKGFLSKIKSSHIENITMLSNNDRVKELLKKL